MFVKIQRWQVLSVVMILIQYWIWIIIKNSIFLFFQMLYLIPLNIVSSLSQSKIWWNRFHHPDSYSLILLNNNGWLTFDTLIILGTQFTAFVSKSPSITFLLSSISLSTVSLIDESNPELIQTPSLSPFSFPTLPFCIPPIHTLYSVSSTSRRCSVSFSSLPGPETKSSSAPALLPRIEAALGTEDRAIRSQLGFLLEELEREQHCDD